MGWNERKREKPHSVPSEDEHAFTFHRLKSTPTRTHTHRHEKPRLLLTAFRYEMGNFNVAFALRENPDRSSDPLGS